MRGKVIQYNAAGGTGIILSTVDGTQHDFSIRNWRSAVAPAVNQTVDITFVDGKLEAAFVVGNDVLMKESLAGVRGAIDNQIASAGGTAGIVGLVQARAGAVGVPAMLAWLVFLVSITILPFASVKFQGENSFTLWEMTDVVNALAAVGNQFNMDVNTSNWHLYMMVSICSIFVPLVWKDKKANFALLLPILLVLGIAGSTYASYASWLNSIESMKQPGGGGMALGNFVGIMSEIALYKFFEAITIGVGAMAMIGSAIYLAIVGVMNAMGRYIPMRTHKIMAIAALVFGIVAPISTVAILKPQDPEKVAAEKLKQKREKEMKDREERAAAQQQYEEARQRAIEQQQQKLELQNQQQQVQDSQSQPQPGQPAQPQPAPTQAERDSLKSTNKKLDDLLK